MTKLKIDNDLIRELAAILNETGLTELEISDNGKGLRVSRVGSEAHAVTVATPAPSPTTEKANPVPDNIDDNAVF